MDVYFGDSDWYKLERQGGLLYVTLRVLYAGGPADGTEVKFILDTGAYLTVISRGTAVRRGYDKLPKRTTTLFGFSGGVMADYVRIPGMIIKKRTRTDVPVLIPHDMYRTDPVTNEKKQLQDVLGLNVLEYYNYYVDSENDRLYLRDNPNPKLYDELLESGQVFTANTGTP